MAADSFFTSNYDIPEEAYKKGLKGWAEVNISEYTIELVKDPFGILPGKRYEFKVELDLEEVEEEELRTANGIYARVVYKVDEGQSGIVTCDLLEKTTNRYLDFVLEAEELAELSAFCEAHLEDPES